MTWLVCAGGLKQYFRHAQDCQGVGMCNCVTSAKPAHNIDSCHIRHSTLGQIDGSPGFSRTSEGDGTCACVQRQGLARNESLWK